MSQCQYQTQGVCGGDRNRICRDEDEIFIDETTKASHNPENGRKGVTETTKTTPVVNKQFSKNYRLTRE